MASHWATQWVNQAKEGHELRLDPCHLPQSVAYVAPQSGIAVTCALNERGILLKAADAHDTGDVVRVLQPKEFRGIAARAIETREGDKAIALILLHNNPDFCVPLRISHNLDDVLLDWRLWSDSYDLPMLSIDDEGTIKGVRECSPLQHFFPNTVQKPRSRFLLRCRGRSLNLRLVISNQVMLG